MRVATSPLLVSSLVVACWAAGNPDAARAQANGTVSNSGAVLIFQRAADSARAAFPRLAGAQPRVVPGAAQYQQGLTALRGARYAEALAPLQEAARLNANSALYHGDLAAVYAGLERWDEAALELVLARRAQGQNQWYTVALAAANAIRRQWADAATNLQAAVLGDSAIIDSVLAEAAVQWSWRARRNAEMLGWAQLATRRYPGIAEPWLRLASYYQQQRDTTRGAEAIHRYVALRPDDPTGQFVFSVFMYDLSRNDSALAFATRAAGDSANRERASEVLFGIGARALTAGRADTAMLALSRAQSGVAPELRPRVSLFLGHAQLQGVAALDQRAERNRDCDAASGLDSLLSVAATNLEAGLALDSARVAPILNSTIPQYRQRSAALVRQVCAGRRRP